MKEHLGTLGIPIEGIPIQMHGEFRANNWKQYYSQACTLQDEFASEMDKAQAFSKTISVDLLNSFNQCINSAGTRMIIVNSQDTKLFSLQLSHKSTLSSPDAATITQLLAFQVNKDGQMSPLSCIGIGIPYNLAKRRISKYLTKLQPLSNAQEMYAIHSTSLFKLIAKFLRVHNWIWLPFLTIKLYVFLRRLPDAKSTTWSETSACVVNLELMRQARNSHCMKKPAHACL